jgi:hypothetical protein
MRFLIIGVILVCTNNLLQASGIDNWLPKANIIAKQQNNYGFEAMPTFITESVGGYHFTYIIKYNNIEVWPAYIKVNLAKDGTILSIFKWLPEKINLTPENKLINKNLIYFNNNGQVQLAYKINFSYSNKDSTVVLDAYTNKVLFTNNNVRYLKKDTIIKATIFKPDPLTTAMQVYAGTYTDNNDANNASLQAALINTNVLATYDTISKTFLLENKWVKIADLFGPNIAPITSTTDSFIFSRDTSYFEQVNALYHITNFHTRLDSLGFASLMNKQIYIDANGQFGADNSAFISSGVNPVMDMGTGGVDDAEDADVIIHEYSHALSWDANKNFILSGSERSALDEGLADYFATSYSKAIDTFGWWRMFTWDGHNQYWDGRVANTTNNYVSPFVQSVYYGGEIWNAAMMQIWDAIGADKTDKLMLQAMYSFTDNTTLPLAAALIHQADSILFANNHFWEICTAFQNKGIQPTWGCYSLPIQQISYDKPSISTKQVMANTYFSLGNNNTLEQVKIFSINGALILNYINKANNLLGPSSPGIYYIYSTVNNVNSITKLIVLP